MRLYQRIARKGIYRIGRKVPAKTKSGFKLDRTLPVEHVPGGPVDSIVIPAGRKYFTWHPKGQSWQYSLHKPDLRSEWQITIDDFGKRADLLDNGEDESEDKDDLVREIEEKKEELETNLSNMPEALQEGHILNERIEELQELLNALDNS